MISAAELPDTIKKVRPKSCMEYLHAMVWTQSQLAADTEAINNDRRKQRGMFHSKADHMCSEGNKELISGEDGVHISEMIT